MKNIQAGNLDSRNTNQGHVNNLSKDSNFRVSGSNIHEERCEMPTTAEVHGVSSRSVHSVAPRHQIRERNIVSVPSRRQAATHHSVAVERPVRSGAKVIAATPPPVRGIKIAVPPPPVKDVFSPILSNVDPPSRAKKVFTTVEEESGNLTSSSVAGDVVVTSSVEKEAFVVQPVVVQPVAKEVVVSQPVSREVVVAPHTVHSVSAVSPIVIEEIEHNVKCHNEPTYIHDVSFKDCDCGAMVVGAPIQFLETGAVSEERKYTGVFPWWLVPLILLGLILIGKPIFLMQI